MSKPKRSTQLASGSTRDFSQDEMLEVLSNQRRRFVIYYLKKNGDDTTVSDLAEHIASWENDKSIEELTSAERKRVRNALRQFHLPKMADYGFVKYDSQRGTVNLTETTTDVNFYIDSLTGGDIPWGVYYLVFSLLSAICLVGLWIKIFPFTVLPPLVWGAFFVTALVVSSLGHFYDNYYRMRLGARDEPPGVETE